jgi:hypothetical protein
MQQIIAQMMFGGDPNLAVAEMSPWLDLRVPPKDVKLPEVEAQTPRRFINKGVNGRWAESLTQEDVAEYETRAAQELGVECAGWLANGAR